MNLKLIEKIYLLVFIGWILTGMAFMSLDMPIHPYSNIFLIGFFVQIFIGAAYNIFKKN